MSTRRLDAKRRRLRSLRAAARPRGATSASQDEGAHVVCRLLVAATDPPSDGFPRAYGKYELLGRLGDGGMAEVFLARLPGLAGFRKTVVIKRILPHLAHKKRFAEMFVAEASLAAEVRHRNVVQVYELGTVNDELYMAMEYVEGTDLRVLLGQAAKRGLRIPPWFSVHLVCEVLEALAYAWALEDDEGRQRRIVHRDVTPSNIFISDQGEVKLGDFGVARDDTRESRTRAGQLKGKLAYMAPEQLYSEPPDHRVDVFAAGVVLWEALAQRRLFGGRPEIEVMQAITSAPRRAPSEHVGDIPPRLDAIVLSALEADKRARIPSAEEFQHHLLEVLPKLRAQIRPSEVRAVVAALLGRVAPEDAGIGPLAAARSSAGVRGPSASSFTPSSDVSSSPGGPAMVDPPYDGSGPAGTPDLVGDLSLGGGGRVKAPTAPPSFGVPILSGRPVEEEGLTAPRPHPRPSTAVLRGRPIEERAASPSLGSEASSYRNPGVSTLDPHAAKGLLSPGLEEYDIDALVQDAVSSVERSSPGTNVVPKDHMLAGLEHRRLLDNSRRLKSERWSFILDQEVYQGEHPFWVRDHEGTEVGPCSFEQALQIVKVECQAGVAQDAHVSTERGRWLALQTFLELAGMESLTADEPPTSLDRASWSGTAEEHTISSVLAALTRAGANGRLIVEAERGGPEGYRIIEVARGRPTYVWAAGEALQIPQMLVSKRIVHPRLMPQMMFEVLDQRIPLGRVLARVASIDIRRYFPMLMKERLSALFSEGFGRFAFDASHPPHSGEPFARSLLSPVSELTFRLVPTERIEARLHPVMTASLEPVRDFGEMVDALGLKPEHAQIADRLVRGKKLGKLLDICPPAQARAIRTVAYILLEAELVRPI